MESESFFFGVNEKQKIGFLSVLCTLRGENKNRSAKLRIGRLFRYQTLLGILSPIVAVMLAFVVGGIIILVFIKSFVFTPAAFVGLQEKGVPADVRESLQALKGKEFPNKSAFEKDVKSAIGEQRYRLYGGLIAGHILAYLDC